MAQHDYHKASIKAIHRRYRVFRLTAASQKIEKKQALSADDLYVNGGLIDQLI
jgi:hypothetical protein